MSPSSGQLHLTGNLKMGWSLLPWMAEGALLDSPSAQLGSKAVSHWKATQNKKGFEAAPVVPSLCWHLPLKSCFLQKHSWNIYFCALPTNQIFLMLCSTLEVLMAKI